MKSNTRNEIQEDKIAAIGIGAMIVFIALILVAAVAAAVIIQTAEKLQQNAQKTGDDTADNMAGKIMIMQGNVATASAAAHSVLFTAGEAYLLMVRLAPGSDTTALNSITFQLFCTNGVVEGTMGTVGMGTAAAMTAHATAVTSLTPGVGYLFWIDGNGGGVDCSPDSGDASVELYLHVANGGTTFETLTIDNTAGGSLVV